MKFSQLISRIMGRKTICNVLCFLSFVLFILNLSASATEDPSLPLTGQMNCGTESHQIMNAQWEPFDKNPAEVDLGAIVVAAGHRISLW